MRRNAGWLGVTLVVIGVLVLTAAVVEAQPQGGRGARGGRGMMGGDPTAMMQVELTWSTVNFACALAEDQFGTLRAACQKAMDDRMTAFAEARQAQNREGMADKIKQINTALEEEVKKLLTEEQLAAATAWRTELTTNMQKLVQAAAQGQQQGQAGRRGGPMGAIMGASYVDRLWGQATFTAKATDEQLKELKPDFQEEWDLRKEALAAGDVEALGTTVEEGQKLLMEALADVLTEEQMQSLQRRGPGAPGGRARPGGGQGQ